MHQYVFAVGAAMLFIASRAIALPPTLISLDSNRDGYVARSEFVALARQRFDAMDSDRNGRVSKSELRGFAFKQRTATAPDLLFAGPGTRPKFEFDAKGEIDSETFLREVTRLRFDPLDRDRDGRLSATEVGK